MPLLDGLRVVQSAIHGYGVVATRAFGRGDTVCFGDGVLYSPDDEFDDTYALILDGKGGSTVLWDLVDQTRWFNHSCDPNTEVFSQCDDGRDGDDGRGGDERIVAWWVAVRDIAPGDEITYDYAFAAEVAEPCACGTASCRGVIVDPDPVELARLSEQLRSRLKLSRPGPSARVAS
jgi:hypothetical protein